MVAQLCQYGRNHWIVYFKLVSFTVCDLCLNKAVAKKKIEFSEEERD